MKTKIKIMESRKACGVGLVKKKKIKLIVVGKNLKNLEKILSNKKYVGTIIV